MVGSALVRRLAHENCEILTIGRDALDLRRQRDVENYLTDTRPDAVILAAARVGGILANDTAPADFLLDNLTIETNVISASHATGVPRLVFLGSSCIYPRLAPQPITEDALLTGPLEPTNQWYAVAKIAGLKLVEALRRQHGRDYISAMPTNLFGPHDNFDPLSSHVLPAMIRKVHEAKCRSAKSISIWGSGMPRREFLHVDDCADALIFLLKTYSEDQHINVGSGEDVSILDLAKMVCKTVGFNGAIVHDLSKPDGTPRKLMSNAKLAERGWRPAIPLEAGLAQTYAWFKQNLD